MTHFKRSDLGYIEVHNGDGWVGVIADTGGGYDIEIWSESYKEWFEHGTYKTLKQAYKAVKELI